MAAPAGNALIHLADSTVESLLVDSTAYIHLADSTRSLKFTTLFNKLECVSWWEYTHSALSRSLWQTSTTKRTLAGGDDHLYFPLFSLLVHSVFHVRPL